MLTVNNLFFAITCYTLQKDFADPNDVRSKALRFQLKSLIWKFSMYLYHTGEG